jgi:hypothetical protein
MSGMTNFEFDVLGAVSNDYEAAHTICSGLARDLGRPVSVEEVVSALAHLTKVGLVDAFVYDSSAKAFRQAPKVAVSPSDLWFMINSVGRAEYERFAG